MTEREKVREYITDLYATFYNDTVRYTRAQELQAACLYNRHIDLAAKELDFVVSLRATKAHIMGVCP